MMLKDVDFQILTELMKNSKISDRALAKKIGVSQATITRKRARLEKQRLLEYTAIPNLKEIDYEIIAFLFLTWKREPYEKLVQEEDFEKRISAAMSEYPNVIFASSGQGLGMTRIAVTIHKNYSDYVAYRRKLESEWGRYIDKTESFIVSLKSDIVLRPLTFKHFAEYLREHG